MSNNIGWFKIHRKLFDNPIYKDLEMRGAFITLIGKTNWRENYLWYCKKENRCIPVAVGQLACSQLGLAKEFGWGVRRTRNYLKLLESDGTIALKAERNYTIITICNYSRYQDSRNDDSTNVSTKPDIRPATQTTHDIRSKEDKEDKESLVFEFKEFKHSDSLIDQSVIVRLKTTEIKKLLSQITKEELRYWIDQRIYWLIQNPKELKKNNRSDYLAINNWRKRKIEQGFIWDNEFMLVAGFYKQWEIDNRSKSLNQQFNKGK